MISNMHKSMQYALNFIISLWKYMEVHTEFVMVPASFAMIIELCQLVMNESTHDRRNVCM